MALVAAFVVSALFRWWNPAPAILLDPADPEVIAAKERARQTLAEFWQAHINPTPEMDYFALKIELPDMDDGVRESLWLSEISEREGRIYGRIDNDTIHPDFHCGQVIPVDPDRIVDWMYAVNRKVRGHFLTRVMVKQSPKRLARRVKKELGWTDADLSLDGAALAP
jgi:uncharacterized protein YegJ (DUF2314 family)